MHNVNSFTADVQASLSDNGKEIYQVSSVSQMDLKGDASSSSVSINNGSVVKRSRISIVMIIKRLLKAVMMKITM